MSNAIPATPVVEPVTHELLAEIAAAGFPPIYTLSPADARKALADFQAPPTHLPPADIEDTTFPVGPTGTTRIRIIRPRGVSAPLPVVMHFHGGGWILGDRETHNRLSRDIAHGTGAAVVFVDFDRAPEAQFPVQIEQAYAATEYVAEHGAELGLDPSRIAVAGDSAGGNMAAVVAILAKERGGPQLAFQWLMYPVTDAGMDFPSYTKFETGFWLLTKAMAWFWDAYQPDTAARKHYTASPLQATIAQLRDLPPALIYTAGNDILRDEGEAYAHKLWEAGVPTTSVRYNGTIHDFLLINQLAETSSVRAAIAQGTAAIRAAFRA